MTARVYIALAALGSAALLAGAFGYQYIGGYLPCAMCLWQRWPHVGAMVLGALGMALPRVWVAGLGAVTMLGNAGLGLYHTGVEQDWWEGPATCSGAGQDLTDLTGAQLLDFSATTTVVPCDAAALHILGLSMASWNAVLCVVLAGVWLMATRRDA